MDNPHALSIFVSKFPDVCRKRFVILKTSAGMEDKRALEVMNEFMIRERELQLQLESYNRMATDNKHEKNDRSDVGGAQCRRCNKFGHTAKDCWSKGSKKFLRTW